MAKRNEEPDDPRPIRRLLRRLVKAPAAWSLIWPLLLIVASYFAMTRWYAEYLADQYRSIDPQLVSVSQPHRYVRSDIVDEVYRATDLAKLSPLDRQATAKLASAFASHPWVRHVQSVRKLPGGKVDVQLEYRVPVAVFHVTSDKHPVDSNLYFVLDGEGVLLPTEKMTLDDTPDFIHIEVREAYPSGEEGTPFGDRRVESAALLAKLLMAVREQIRIAKITVSGDPRMNLVPQLELITGNNTRLFWGSPPGMEQPGERQARSKLVDLLQGNFVQGSDLRIAETPQSGRK
ncbi:FtsQ-type POTRA domain-containing protein [Roseiconus nitratireducens]|uniref:FtsQ-type POTRA domain-containing protein n=1 Tax=Roseiconus nitratireducens TaxID=2605748 RepID=A0A5M6DHH0_9BACT|nr:FtsQ-type POTRA domain-containing protein [Roseiconus nitratireducens]KAA5546903.1 FtsQ-type POTRA domain-containing protein [Roseiconus nitratireducens]